MGIGTPSSTISIVPAKNFTLSFLLNLNQKAFAMSTSDRKPSTRVLSFQPDVCIYALHVRVTPMTVVVLLLVQALSFHGGSLVKEQVFGLLQL